MLKFHFIDGFTKLYGIQTTALKCKHCKEIILYGYGISKRYAMLEHVRDEHPLLYRIYG